MKIKTILGTVAGLSVSLGALMAHADTTLTIWGLDGDNDLIGTLAAEFDARAKDLLRHRPNDADLHYWSAAAKLLLGDREGALGTIAAAISREPHQLTDALHDELFADLLDDLEDLSLSP